MHALRVGYQGLELLRTGCISLPIPEPQRSRLMEVRQGETPLDQILAELDSLIRELEAAPVPPTSPSNERAVERWMVETYRRHWDQETAGAQADRELAFWAEREATRIDADNPEVTKEERDWDATVGDGI